MRRFTLLCGAAMLLSTAFIAPKISNWLAEETENEAAEELLESANKRRNIEEAIRQEFELTKSPLTGTVPREKLLEAQAYAAQRLADAGAMQRSIPGINWTERGPTNVGGRTRALLFDRNDATLKKIFAGAADGGLWMCPDVTAALPTWSRVSAQFDNLAVTTIAQHPTSPATLYFGTGEGFFNVDAVQGLGIWRSTDGGANWQHLPSTTGGDFKTVQKMIVTANGDVYAATSPGGIQRSRNGGLTWEKVLGGGPGADLELAANGNLWASIGLFSPGSVWVSPSGDAGSWENKTPANPATNGMQRIEIATAPSDANTLYLLGHDGNSNDCNNIWYTNNSGVLWTLRTAPTGTDQVPTSPNFTRGQAWYDLTAAVDPNNPLTLIIGGVDLHKSINSGATWIHLSKWYNSLVGPFPTLPVVHADQHSVVFRPGSSANILFGNDGGIFYTPNMSVAVTEATPATYESKVNGYNVTQFYAVAVHPTNPDYFLAGAQDNGSQRFIGAGAVPTTEATGGDGAFCHIDQQDPNFQFTSFVYNNYFRSTNGGATFASTVSNSTNGSFINPTALDNASKILYADYTTVATRIGGQYAYWNTRGSSTTMTPVTVTAFANASVTHVAVSPNVANRVYFGLSNGRIAYVNGANTATGTVAGTLIRTGQGSVSGIAVEPGNEQHILVTYANYDVQNVWETTDGGANWTSVEGNLPNMPVRWAVFNPTNPDQAFLATELGVWSTDDMNGTATEWNPTNGGLANCRIDMLRIAGNQLSAATHGRGLFTTALTGGAPNAPAINFASNNGGAGEASSDVVSGCKPYKDFPVSMYISAAPIGNATVTLSVAGNTATATEGQDYDLLPKTLTFTSGSTSAQQFVVRVYNDAAIEPTSEFFTINYTITGATNAVKATALQEFDFRIADDDYLGVPHGVSTVAFPTGFYNTNLGGSSPLQGSQSDKKMQYLYRRNELLAQGLKAGPISSLAFVIGTKGSVQPFMGFTILMGTVPAATTSLSGFAATGGFTPVYSAPAGGYTTTAGENKFTLATPFNWDGVSNIVVQFCYNNLLAAPAAPVALPVGTGDDILQGETDPLGLVSQVRAVSTNQPTDDGCAFTTPTLLSTFRPLLYLEQAVPETAVQTLVNRSRTANLGPNEDVYFYDETDGKLLARIQNLSSIDYGCTVVQTDRQATGSNFALPFFNNSPANYVTAKSFKVLPALNGTNAAGRYKITLYYTDAEKAGYTAATAKSWNNTELVKVSNGFFVPDVSPASPHLADVTSMLMTPGTVGTNWSATAEFTNATFGGFAVGTPGLSNIPLAASLIGFTGKLYMDHGQVNWTVTGEDNRGYYVERSVDGRTFTSIGYIAAQANTGGLASYTFTDPARAGSIQYYRLSIVKVSGAVAFSNVVKLQTTATGAGVQVYPTVTNGLLNIRYSQPLGQKATIAVYNAVGARVAVKQSTTTTDQLNIGNLASGSYQVIITANGGETLYSGTVIKQ